MFNLINTRKVEIIAEAKEAAIAEAAGEREALSKPQNYNKKL